MGELKNEEVQELNQQAKVLASNGKQEAAIEYLQKAQDLEPMYLETYINMGNIYAAMEQYDSAFESYQKVLMVDKHSAIVYFHIGNMYFLQGKLDEGVKSYNTAISEGLDEAIVYFNLGLLYEEKKDIEFALRNYSKAIFKNPDAPEYRLKKATLQIQNYMYEEALETLNDMTKYAPDVFEGYHFKFEVLCALKRFEDAEKLLKAAGDLFPGDVSIFYDKIQLQTRIGNLDKAMQMIDEAEKMEGHEAEKRNLLFEKGKIYGIKEDMDSSLQCFLKCLEFETEGKTDFEVRYFLMNIYLSQKNFEALLEHSEKVLQNPENNPYVRAAFYYRALAVKNLKSLEEAKEYYKEAVSLYRTMTLHNPTQLEAYLFRALCHKDLKEFEKALELVEFVKTLNPESSEIHVIKSNIFEDMGRKEEAEAEMALAKELKPELKLVV